MGWRRFIRCASDHPVRVGSSGAEGIFGWLLTSLLRRNALVLVGSSGAEDFASTRLTCSLVHPPVITPMPQLGIIGSSGATWFFSHQCSKLHRRRCVGSSDANRILRCYCIGSSSATDFCRTRSFHSFFEFFHRVSLYLAFLLHPCDL